MSKEANKSSNTIALNKKPAMNTSSKTNSRRALVCKAGKLSIRAGKANISDSYVIIKDGEAIYWCGNTTAEQASSHVYCEPDRSRKLLLKRRELDKLIGAAEREGYSIVATAMYWKGPWAKLEIHLAKGKKSHDKRDTVKERDWQRQKSRILKHSVR